MRFIPVGWLPQYKYSAAIVRNVRVGKKSPSLGGIALPVGGYLCGSHRRLRPAFFFITHTLFLMSHHGETIIFSMAGVSKIYPPQKQVLKNIYLSFFYGAKIGVLGLNGSGKSSLLKVIAGVDKQFQGEVAFSPGYTVGYLEQEPHLDPTKTVREIVEEGVAETVALLKEFDEINEAFGAEDADFDKLLQGVVQEKLDQLNAWELDNKLERAMDALRTPAQEAIVGNLSGGEKRRVALCRLLLQEPDVLLLDEPTNHLDAESVLWLEQHLQQYKGTVIAVTHDRYFLDNVAGWILELDRGEGIPWKGNYSSWLEQKTQRLAKRQKTLQRELDWVRMAPKARQAKSKARLAGYEKLASEEAKEKESRLELFIPDGPRLGAQVIEAHGLRKAFGDKLLFDNLEFSLPQGGIVGIIGPNGAGKTTLFRLITGQLQPDGGTFDVGPTVQTAYVDQQHDTLDPAKSVFETISGGTETMLLAGRQVNARQYVGRFNFQGADQEKKVGTLSGGERNRVHLAQTLKQGANLLLLDEPTNDLDVNAIRALEDALENFAGCAVIISHDRWFLDRLATHILAFEGDSEVIWFEGNFSDYEEAKRKRLGDVAPKRVKYKKLN
jgi:energy-dependent translational throttle protein EttA